MPGRVGGRARKRSLTWFRNEEGCFLLNDQFNGNFPAPLATPRRCRPGPGQLILDQTDGQFYITAGRFIFPAQATPTWGDQDWYALQNDGDEYDVLDQKKLILKFRGMWTDAGQTDCWLGWNLDTSPDTVANAEHTFYRSGGPASGILCTSGASDGALTLRDLWPGGGNFFQVAVVLRPYTVGGLHWYPDAPGVFAHGAHFFYRDESADPSHHLLAWYRQLQSRTDPLYPAFSNYDSEGDLEYVVIPCDDEDIWHPLLTPILEDTFTDNNGVLLPNHTMDYGGYAWVNAVGVWQITGNEADPDNTANAHCYAPTLTPDAWIEANGYRNDGNAGYVGLLARRSEDTGGGTNLWHCRIRYNTAANDAEVVELNNGISTTRAAADIDPANGWHNLRLRCDDQQLTFYVDYVEVGHYATAWFNRHATHHGLYSIDAWNNTRFDNFIILPRGTGLIRICYDDFEHPNGTSLDATVTEEGALAWVEDVGDWDVQANEANVAAGGYVQAYIVTNVSNIWACTRLLCQAFYAGLLFRKSADTVGGGNYWYFSIRQNAGIDTLLQEQNDGVNTTRASADTDTYVAGTRYYLDVQALGQVLNCYVDGTLRANYGLASFNETATWHGLHRTADLLGSLWDQFRVTEIPALGEYDVALDSIE